MSSRRFDPLFVAQAPAGQTALHDNETTEASGWRPRGAGTVPRRPHRPGAAADHEPGAPGTPCQRGQRTARGALPSATILPRPFEQDGLRTICYPGDPLHSVPERAARPTRLCYQARRFCAEDGFDALFC